VDGARRHLTFANVASTVAVFVALAAGAWAAGLPKNSVKSRQIKDGAVHAQDIHTDAVTGPKILHGELVGGDFAPDSLTGSEIDESTLQGITAAEADTVGDGVTVKKISYGVAATNTPTTLVNFPGHFRINAQCTGGATRLDLAAFTEVNDARISSIAWGGAGASDSDGVTDVKSTSDSSFNAAETFNLGSALVATDGSNAVVIHYSEPGGFEVDVDMTTDEHVTDCRAAGFAVAG
jgi:hypothetical protein